MKTIYRKTFLLMSAMWTQWRSAMVSSGIAACLLVGFGSPSSVIGQRVRISVYQNYVPPPWAPPYDNVSQVRYYYLPDYDMYYDVWSHEYWYLEGGVWVAYQDLPPIYSDLDLSSAFIVLIDRNISEPWHNYGYYHDNYPSHGYDRYREIVVNNRIVTNIQPGHELMPRAYNENNDRVTFMQHPRTNAQAPNPSLQNRQPGDQHTQNPQVTNPQVRTLATPMQYHHVVHEVPMKSISPSMPKESRAFNYGGGYHKPPQTQTARTPAAPAQRAPAQNGSSGHGQQGGKR